MGSNWKTTFALLVMVVTLGLWVYYGEEQLQTTSELETREKRLFPHLKLDQVTGIEIQRPGAEGGPAQRVVLERTGGEEGKDATWRMLAPVEDQADDAAANRLLNNLQYAQFSSQLSPGAAQGYDFGRTILVVTIYRRETLAYKMAVGEARGTGEHPVKIEGREGLFLVRGDLIQTNFPADPFEWRQKQVLTLGGRAIDKIRVERPGEPTLELAYEDGFWRLGQAGEFAARARVEELTSALRGLKASGVERESPSQQELEPTLLASPPIHLWLEAEPAAGQGERGQEELLVGAAELGEGLRYVRSSLRQPLYKADTSKLLEALSGDPASWRSDALLPLTGGGETVTGFGARWPDGTEWHVEKKDEGWSFSGPDPRRAASPARCQDLAKELAGLKILERVEPGSVDAATTGLGAPRLQVALVEGALQRQVDVGNPVEGRPGVYYVQRPKETQLFLVELGLLPERLREAPLELLDPVILRASPFDQKKIQLTDPAGQVVLLAEKQKQTVDGAEVERWQVLTQPGPGQADPEVFARFAETFGQVPVARWVGPDSEAARRDAGLGEPQRLTVTVGVYKDGKLVDEERTLLLGRREGNRVLAQTPGGPIGLIDAGFLDRIQRGFTPGQELVSFDKFEARGLLLREGDKVLLELRKPGEVWKRGLTVLDTTEAEALLEGLTRVEVTRAEPATPERRGATGLEPPRRRLTIETRGFDEGAQDQTRTLLIGEPAGPGQVWVMREGGDTLGVMLSAPLDALDEWLAAHPAADPFPPVAPPGGGDVGPVASPQPPGDQPPGGQPPGDRTPGEREGTPPEHGGDLPPGDTAPVDSPR